MTEVRMLCADLVAVCWRDQAGKAKKAQAVLEDISASGACSAIGDGNAAERRESLELAEAEFCASNALLRVSRNRLFRGRAV